jgi:hypothetical protein
MAGVTYDTGALLAAERGDRRMWALHTAFLINDVVPTVPAPVLAQAWRGGGRQASLARALAACVVEALTAGQARAVGEIVGRAEHGDVVDVAVVEGAVRRGDVIVTSDPDDLADVLDAIGARLALERV